MILGVKGLRKYHKFSGPIIWQHRGKTKQSKIAFDTPFNIVLYKYHQYHYHYIAIVPNHLSELFSVYSVSTVVFSFITNKATNLK